MSNFCFDFASYWITAGLTLALVFGFGIEALTDQIAIVIIVFGLYGATSATFTYCCSFAFGKASTAQLVMIMLNLLGGMVLMLASFIMFFLESTYEINKSLMMIYRLLP